ncbi:COG1361 family protein [Tautonia sociabilis]|uniref:DUF11 domain-containing protein n=1 Tax=Tautonia sociabilis TaxID=2080755 RepID=A0A432MMP0_9BACT|nr:CARDB domain-containing protein [Tautonia sociabilis]RUL88711.1 DUF11 domain-containing protein [Tautonia sociabilis]
MRILNWIASAGLAALVPAAVSPAVGQDSKVDLYFPTGEESTSLLMIRAEAPEEVRVGQQFQYAMTVRNIAKAVTLEDIRIRHDGSQYFSIEGSQVGEHPAQGQDGQQARAGQRQDGQQARAGERRQNRDPQGEGIRIGELKPGESKTLRIRAVAEREGTAGVCFRVSYNPTVCLVTRITKPEIQVTKAVPEVADICQPLRFRYTVKNTGTADVRNVVVSDDLPDGLQTEDGKTAVRHEIGELPAGQSKEFTVDLCATRTGRFASRAVAEAGELHARSNNPSTQIVAARLSVRMEGPEAQYLNQPATYRVTVRNEGDGPALDTRLEVDVDPRTRLIRTSRTSLNSVEPRQTDDRTLRWDIGTLEPGEETAVSFTVDLNRVPAEGEADRQGGQDSQGQQAFTFRHVAEVTSRCADAKACADEEIRKSAAASVNREVELVTLPALLLELVDRYDQVPVGENVDYVLTIINQGSGADSNVRLTVTLPDSLEFVRADGMTEAQHDGQRVSFEPIDRLAPGEEARFEVVARANRAGQVSTSAELASDFLRVPAREAEPTVLIGEGVDPRPARNDQGQDRDNSQKNDENTNQGQGGGSN